MLKGAKLNFPSNPEYKKEEFKCDFCPLISTQRHLIWTCPEYEEYRKERNLEEDKELCKFLEDVMTHRLIQDDEDDA